MGGSRNTEYKRGLWTQEEDRLLMDYIKLHGKGKWNRVAKETGLKRCGKSCRLRWMNYLCPNVKRGDFSEEENDLIIRLHKLLGNRWSLIAGRVPGRTDNQVKNQWNTHLSKKLGINKGKRKIRHSSSIISKEIGENTNSNSSSGPSLIICNNEPPSEKAKDIVTLENVVGLIDTQQKPTSSSYYDQSSFWFLNNDLISPYSTPDHRLMELVDEPLDFLWQGL